MKTKMFHYGSSTFKVSQFNLVRREKHMSVPHAGTRMCHLHLPQHANEGHREINAGQGIQNQYNLSKKRFYLINSTISV
jgi:hypothetical protein